MYLFVASAHFRSAMPALVLPALALGIVAFSPPAQASSPLNKWFPSVFGPEDTSPQPQDTLQAPFAATAAAPASEADLSPSQKILMDIYSQGGQDAARAAGDTIPLTQPHRSPDQIAAWAIDAVSGALSLKAATADPAGHAKTLQTSFDTYALEELQSYMDRAGLYAYSKTNNININAFAEGKPRFVTEGNVQGAYRWKVEIPTMLSYVPANITTLRGAKLQSQHVLVDVQIRRASVKPASARDTAVTAPDGLLIERFSLRSVTR